MTSYSVWLGRGFRLSLLVSVLCAGWNAWTRFSTYAADRDYWVLSKLVYECGARKSDTDLIKTINDYGNYNLKGVYCTDRDFWASPQEIADVRAGKMTFETPLLPWVGADTLISGIFGFVISMLVTLALIGATKTARWIWGH